LCAQPPRSATRFWHAGDDGIKKAQTQGLRFENRSWLRLFYKDFQ